MANKKVLYVVTKASVGGATRYVRDLAMSMKSDFDVVVAAGSGDWLFNELKGENIKTIKLKDSERNISLTKDIKTFCNLLSIIRTEKPDILHLNSSKIGGLGALAGRIATVPRIVFTAHGWAYNEKRTFISKVIFYKLHMLTMLLAHATIANSLHTAKTAPLKKGLRVIYLGIKESVPLSLLEAEQALKKLCPRVYNQVSDKKVSLLSISELHKNKGVDVLLEAMPLVDESVQLTFIGGGDLEQKLRDRAHKLGVEKRVCFTGQLQNAAQYIGIFDIFVLSSRTESFGYVLLEAGLESKPVVATNVGGIPEIIEDGKTGVLVKKEDKKALAHAINELASDKQKREQFGTALKQSVLEKFSFEKMVEETREVYFT